MDEDSALKTRIAQLAGRRTSRPLEDVAEYVEGKSISRKTDSLETQDEATTDPVLIKRGEAIT